MPAKGAGIPTSSQNPLCWRKGVAHTSSLYPLGGSLLILGTSFPAFCEAATPFACMKPSFSFPEFSHFLKKKSKQKQNQYSLLVPVSLWAYAGLYHDLSVAVREHPCGISFLFPPLLASWEQT